MNERRYIVGLFALLFGIMGPHIQKGCDAAPKKHRVVRSSSISKQPVSIVNMRNYASLVVNADTGKIIHQVNAHETRYPASLTKMMTLFIAFDAINSGRLHMDQRLPVSALAARQECSCLPIKAGDTITVRDAIYGAIVKSANNAAYVLGEAVAGNTTKFAIMMNNKAKQLGMKNTRFINPDGLPHAQQVSTAYDMALLGLALKRDHAKYYHMFSTKSFLFKGQTIHSHNHVMKRYPWADGLKTGYVRSSGFNVVTSAKRSTGNLVAVVMGGQTAKARDDHMISLLEGAYRKMPAIRVAQLDSPSKAPSMNGKLYKNDRRSVFSAVDGQLQQ